MHYEADQARFLIVLGESAELVIDDDPAITILDHVDRVVLAETSYLYAAQLRHRSGLTIHSYEREEDARRVFSLFRS